MSTARAPGRGAAIGAAVAAGALLSALAVVQWAGHPHAPFGPGSFADAEAAMSAAGLAVCSAAEEPDPRANQAIASRTYRVAADCTGPAAVVVVDRFPDAADRDATARDLTARTRPRGSGVVYTLRDMTVFVPGTADTDVQTRLNAALHGAGAR
jgi:hypothetical protein